MASGMEIGRATNTGREINSKHSEMEAKLSRLARATILKTAVTKVI